MTRRGRVQLRKILTFLLIAAVLTPIFVIMLLGVGRLLSAMQDAGGALLLDRLALLLAVAWAVDLVAIVLLLAIDQVARQPEDSDNLRGD